MSSDLKTSIDDNSTEWPLEKFSQKTRIDSIKHSISLSTPMIMSNQHPYWSPMNKIHTFIAKRIYSKISFPLPGEL